MGFFIHLYFPWKEAMLLKRNGRAVGRLKKDSDPEDVHISIDAALYEIKPASLQGHFHVLADDWITND